MQADLVSKDPLTVSDGNSLLRCCTRWCLSISDRPGEAGIITEIAEKLVSRYKKLAGPGENLVEQTREIRNSISKRIRRKRCDSKKLLGAQDTETVEGPPAKAHFDADESLPIITPGDIGIYI